MNNKPQSKLKFSQPSVCEIQIASPDGFISRVSNAAIWNNTLYLPEGLSISDDKISAYEPWPADVRPRRKRFKTWLKGRNTAPKSNVAPRSHFEIRRSDEIPEDISSLVKPALMVFDTWGTSSYYHLLIDHIIPLWMTRKHLQMTQGILGDEKSIDYYRISTNEYPTDLGSAQQIFSHFMGQEFHEKVAGKYQDIVCGFFYNLRPYHGPHKPAIRYDYYAALLRLFRQEFCKLQPTRNGPILVPVRETRTSSFVDAFVQKHSETFNFQQVDLGAMSIEQQIEICGRSAGIFGAEGAAFANQVFLPDDSIVVPVAKEPERFAFHKPLADYCGHTFLGADEAEGEEALEKLLFQTLKAHAGR